jgi:hypothetical protein
MAGHRHHCDVFGLDTLGRVRVRYNDESETWLYFTPSLAQMVKFDKLDRANRWAYYGLHVMDCRPVQSSAVVGYRDDRIAGRHCGDEYHDAVARLPTAETARGPWLEMGVPQKTVKTTPSLGWAMSESDRIAGDRWPPPEKLISPRRPPSRKHPNILPQAKDGSTGQGCYDSS